MTCILEPWRAPARRKQGRRSASPRRTSGCCRKFSLTALQSTFDEFNPPSMNLTIGRASRAEAIRRASTSVSDPIRCERRSRWPSSGRQDHQPLAAGDAGVEELEMRRSVHSNVPVRGRQCPSHEGAALVPTQSLGTRLAKRIGSKKARVAIARKIVVRHGFETPGCACSGGQG